MHLDRRPLRVRDLLAGVLNQDLYGLASGQTHDPMYGVAQLNPALDHPGHSVLASGTVWFQANALRTDGRLRLADDVGPAACGLQLEIVEPDPAAPLAVGALSGDLHQV